MRLAVAHTPADIRPPELEATGGPKSRRRTQALESSVLGRRRGRVHCPRARTLALDFLGADPLEVVYALLDQLGFPGASEAEAALLPDLPKCFCRVTPGLTPLEVRRVKDTYTNGQGPLVEAEVYASSNDCGGRPGEEALVQALLLGHCTAFLFDPDRPLLWTRASLARRLELFEGEGFYA